MMTAGVRVHGAVLVPFSNPGLPSNCFGAFVLTVRLIVVVWLRLPDVPVMVTVDVPVVAVLLAENVSVLVLVVGLVLKVAVTPEGRVEVERLTLPVNPPESVTVIVLLPLPPWFTVKLLGEAESEKLGVAVALTVRLMVVVWLRLPEVPVMVTVEVPVVAVLLAENVTALLLVAGFVPKLIVTPDGNPEADKLTLPVNPPESVTLIVVLALPPWVTFTLLGEADKLKFCAATAGGSTQLFAALENSSWIVYVVPLAV